MDLLSINISKSVAKDVDREFPNKETKEIIINQYTKHNKLDNNLLQGENKEINGNRKDKENIKNEKQNEKIKNEEKTEITKIVKKTKIKDAETVHCKKSKLNNANNTDQQNINNIINTWCNNMYILRQNMLSSSLNYNEKLFYNTFNDIQKSKANMNIYDKNNRNYEIFKKCKYIE